MKQIIYDQAVLEGVSTTFPDTETIIDNAKKEADKIKRTSLFETTNFFISEENSIIIKVRFGMYLIPNLMMKAKMRTTI